MIGRVGRVTINMLQRRPYRATKDLTRADYQFYDKLRRCTAEGLHLSALLVKPVLSKIASWVMGIAPQWKVDDPESQDRLNAWWGEWQADILATYEDSMGLGDYYLVFNADGTITPVSPDVVEPIVSPDNYAQIIGWRITERYQHPTEIHKYMIEVNEYYADVRLRWVEFETTPPLTPARSNTGMESYRNLLGVIPVVHVPNNRGGNQIFGTPELEALVATENNVLYRYDELLDAALSGNVRQGRPTPVMTFNDLASLDDFFTRNATRVTDDETDETYYEVDFDGDKLVMAVGDFKYASPAGASGDAKTLLEVLYWLFVEHTEIPDIIMGTQMGQSRSSGEDQVDTLVKFITKKRGQVKRWVVQLADLALRWLALTEPGIRYTKAPIPAWTALTSEDGQLKFTVVRWAYAEGLIDRQTALELAPTLEIEDVAGVLEAADAEAQTRNRDTRNQVDFDAALDEAIQNASTEADVTEEA